MAGISEWSQGYFLEPPLAPVLDFVGRRCLCISAPCALFRTFSWHGIPPDLRGLRDLGIATFRAPVGSIPLLENLFSRVEHKPKYSVSKFVETQFLPSRMRGFLRQPHMAVHPHRPGAAANWEGFQGGAVMQMFYFDVTNGSRVTRDEAGALLRNLHEAKVSAMVYARRLIDQMTPSQIETYVFQIRDQSGNIVATIAFAEARTEAEPAICAPRPRFNAFRDGI